MTDATTNKLTGARRPDLATLVAIIARSQIVVSLRSKRRRLPDGYDAVDAAILDWIATEARRVSRGRSFVAM